METGDQHQSAGAASGSSAAPSAPPADSEWTLSLLAVLVLAGISHLAGHLFFDPRSWVAYHAELAALRDALPVVQGAMLVMIAILGPGIWWIRMPICAILLAGLASIPILRYPWDDVIYLWGVMGISALGVLAFSVLLSWRGYAIDWPRGEEEGQVRWQFSLLHLIGLTTAVALLIGFYRWCEAAWPGQFRDVEFGIGIATLGLGFAIAAIWIAWESLRPSTWWLRWIPFLVLAMALPVMLWWAASLVNMPRGIRFFGVESVNAYLMDFARWGVAFGLLLAGSLWVLREAGLRLIVVGKPGISAADAKPAGPELGAKGSAPASEVKQIVAAGAIVVLLLGLGTLWGQRPAVMTSPVFEAQIRGDISLLSEGPAMTVRHSITVPGPIVWVSYVQEQQAETVRISDGTLPISLPQSK